MICVVYSTFRESNPKPSESGSMKLRDYLHFNRIKKQDMASQIGVSREYFSNIVNEKNIPSVKLAQKIQQVTGGQVSAMELLMLDVGHKVEEKLV